MASDSDESEPKSEYGNEDGSGEDDLEDASPVEDASPIEDAIEIEDEDGNEEDDAKAPSAEGDAAGSNLGKRPFNAELDE